MSKAVSALTMGVKINIFCALLWFVTAAVQFTRPEPSSWMTSVALGVVFAVLAVVVYSQNKRNAAGK